MTILRDISIIWSFVHALILFAFFFESRFPPRKTNTLLCLTMVPLLILNVWLFLAVGPELAAQLILLTCTLPSLVFFYFLAKRRDGRFFFTFCLADTVSYWVIFVTSILDYYVGGNRYILMFVLRMLGFPLMEWTAWRYLRRDYLRLQHTIQRGWWVFSGISMLYYGLLVVLSSVPTLYHTRPHDLPAIVLTLILMPLMYGNIFYTLHHQSSLQRSEEETRILRLQSAMLTQQAVQIQELEDRLRISRHDLRHQLRTASEMVEAGSRQEALAYLSSAEEMLSSMKREIWCTDPVLNAVFSVYFRQAREKNIRLEVKLSLEGPLPVDATELSTVFGNALENAIRACENLPPEQRFLRCRCRCKPQFMLRISNSFRGHVEFGPTGLPVSQKPGHGIGSRSIAAFCEKHGAHVDYQAENGVFTLRLLIPQS